MDRRCHYPGQPLSSFIPEASTEALDILEGLLSLDPKKRPTASEALADPYIADAQILCDYSAVQLVRPDKEFFEFEQEKFSLEALRAMIVEEVRSPCGPYRSHRGEQRQSVEVDPPVTYRMKSKDDHDEDEDGPKSQARTHTNRTAPQNHITGGGGSSGGGGASGRSGSGSGSGGGGEQSSSDAQLPSGHNQVTSNSQHSTKSASSAEVSRKKPNPFMQRSLSQPNPSTLQQTIAAQQHPQQQQQQGQHVQQVQHEILTSSRSVPSPLHSKPLPSASGLGGSGGASERRTPRTPSPRKIESIVQKDRKAKRLFFIQGTQRLKQQQQSGQEKADPDSNRSAGSRVSDSGKFRRDFDSDHGGMPADHCLPLSFRERSQSETKKSYGSSRSSNLTQQNHHNNSSGATDGEDTNHNNIFSHLHSRYQNLTSRHDAKVHYEAVNAPVTTTGSGRESGKVMPLGVTGNTKLPMLRRNK